MSVHQNCETNVKVSCSLEHIPNQYKTNSIDFDKFQNFRQLGTEFRQRSPRMPLDRPTPPKYLKTFLYKFNPANEMHALEVVKRDSLIKIEP